MSLQRHSMRAVRHPQKQSVAVARVWACFCDVGLILLATHSAKASLATPTTQDNKHATHANSLCQVLNGVEYTSWRPAEALL